MKDSVRVAVAQLTGVSGDMESNLTSAEKMIAEAAGRGADILCFPEYYFIQPESEPVTRQTTRREESRVLSFLREMARKHGLWLNAGYLRGRKSAYFNTSVLVSPAGRVVGRFNKVHPAPNEAVLAGSDYPVFRTELGTIGLLICYDVWFPEAARMLVLAGAEIILIMADVPAGRGGKSALPGHPISDERLNWTTLATARALENDVFVVVADRVRYRPAGGGSMGGSMIISCDGTMLAQASFQREDLIIADLDGRARSAWVDAYGHLRHRRPRTYTGLTKRALPAK
ncbi:MAG: carbon-nitrogen hydrolase family protein [Armatimonadota bacterium]|nr:MAG: carbon-nitrogen hydrolase family protein [Armatimonadota bacterium]